MIILWMKIDHFSWSFWEMKKGGEGEGEGEHQMFHRWPKEGERSEDERRIFQFKQSASLLSILITEIISCIFKAAICSSVDLVSFSSKNLSDSSIIRYFRSNNVCGFNVNCLSISYCFNFLAFLYWRFETINYLL